MGSGVGTAAVDAVGVGATGLTDGVATGTVRVGMVGSVGTVGEADGVATGTARVGMVGGVGPIGEAAAIGVNAGPTVAIGSGAAGETVDCPIGALLPPQPVPIAKTSKMTRSRTGTAP